ncbi:MAG: hypothetical protein RLZZ91_218 [Bacteroidota bacterium]|jgi:hypothetical protein
MNTSVKKGLIIGGTSLILGLAALFWYLGMSNNNRLIAKIPKDAAMVFKADLKSLADKAEFKKWKELSMFDEMRKEESVFDKILDNPKKSGVNFMQNAYGYVSKGDEFYGGIVFGIKDAKDFEETVKGIDDDIEVQKTDGIYTAEVDNNDVALVWDKNVALMYFRDDEEVMEKAKQAFAQDEDMSMLEMDTYMEYESLDADLGMYMNMKRFQELASEMGGQMQDQFKSMEKAESIGVTVLFDDQQMLVDATYYPVEGATPEEISMMKEESISADLMKLISPTTPKGFYAANMDLDKIFGLYPQLNEEMMKDGFSLDEFKNSLNGEMTISLIDVKNVQKIREVADYDSWEPNGFYDTPVPMKMDTTFELSPIYKINLGVKDRGILDNIISKFVTKMNEPVVVEEMMDMEDLMKSSFDSYTTPYDNLVEEIEEPKIKRYQYNGLEVMEAEDIKLYYKYEGNYLSISNDESAFASQNYSWDDELEEMLTEKAGAGYMDLNYKNYPDIERENAEYVQEVKSFLEMLDNMKFSSDGMTFQFEMNFTDSPDHILWRMMKAIDSEVSKNRRGYN